MKLKIFGQFVSGLKRKFSNRLHPQLYRKKKMILRYQENPYSVASPQYAI